MAINWAYGLILQRSKKAPIRLDEKWILSSSSVYCRRWRMAVGVGNSSNFSVQKRGGWGGLSRKESCNAGYINLAHLPPPPDNPRIFLEILSRRLKSLPGECGKKANKRFNTPTSRRRRRRLLWYELSAVALFGSRWENSRYWFRASCLGFGIFFNLFLARWFVCPSISLISPRSSFLIDTKIFAKSWSIARDPGRNIKSKHSN